MNYYKTLYTLDEYNNRVYPGATKGVVWNLTQDHFSEKVMIGATESAIPADGTSIVELAETDARSLIEEYKATYPQPELQAGMPFPAEEPGKR
jgi:hypothetical protein